jgi:hypothetical protein
MLHLLCVLVRALLARPRSSSSFVNSRLAALSSPPSDRNTRNVICKFFFILCYRDVNTDTSFQHTSYRSSQTPSTTPLPARVRRPPADAPPTGRSRPSRTLSRACSLTRTCRLQPCSSRSRTCAARLPMALKAWARERVFMGARACVTRRARVHGQVRKGQHASERALSGMHAGVLARGRRPCRARVPRHPRTPARRV